MPPQPAQRHRPPREFALPNGTRVIVASADSLHSVRQQYRECDEPVEVVVRGSVEHADYLKQSHKHHESRRAQLKERHGAAFDEWEDVQQQINSVTSELSRMSTQSSGLHVNYNKFGYSSGVRTYDDEGEGDNGVESKHPNGSAGAAHESKGGHHEKTTIKLAQRPALRQWFYQNVIWRATEQTEVMAVELFLDLIYGQYTWEHYTPCVSALTLFQSASSTATASTCLRTRLGASSCAFVLHSSCRGRFGRTSPWRLAGSVPTTC